MKQQVTTPADCDPMHTPNERSRSLGNALKACLTICAAMVLCGILGGRPAAWAGAAQAPSNDDVAAQYIQILNAGFLSGDFSGLTAVLAPDATLTQSNAAGKTTVFAGVSAIIDFYQNVLAVNMPGLQFSVDTVRDLSDSVVIEYEHAGSPPLSVPARCSHVFVIHQGQIVSYDFTTFFAGTP